MKRRVKINGFIIFVAIVSIVFFPALFLRNAGQALFDRVMEIFGIAFILLGQIFRASARGYKSEYSQNGHKLIQGGPYALVRNPMYLGILLIGLGIVLMLFNWWAVCIFLLVFTIRYILLIFKEEKNLLAEFPRDYQDYCKKVPRILPSIIMIAKTDIREYLPLKLSWLKKEIGSMLAVLCLALLLESWEDIKNKGIRAYFEEATAITVTIILFIGLVIYLSKRTAAGKGDVSDKG